MKVTQLIDEIGDEKYLGRLGMVVRREVENDVGATVKSPFLIVDVDGFESPDGFWEEELEIVSRG